MFLKECLEKKIKASYEDNNTLPIHREKEASPKNRFKLMHLPLEELKDDFNTKKRKENIRRFRDEEPVVF